jgi:Caspase domain
MSGQRIALIIANDEYDHEALRDLLAPAADAKALGRVLGDRQIGDFTVQVMRNEPAHVIQAQIEELFSESRGDDVLLLHFSGHGLKSESGELFFAASNTRPDRLRATAVSADFVQRCMRDSRSRSVVLLLDCCYGGAFAQGVTVRAAGDVNVLDSFPQERTGGGRGRAVITASNAMEFAFEGNHLGDDRHRRPSVFTAALVEGLATGEADRDEDGWISLNELYYYVFDKVREQNPHQTPTRQVELEGDLYLARSRRQRIRPAPLPPDLQAALADPNMYSRLGAVSELRSRLASGNLPAAAGAYEALAELARTDVQTVAHLAVAALEGVALHPEETELRFGRIEQGSAQPHRTVRLLGPPIARACTPRASHDWIHVDQTAEGLDISVDTARTGSLHGTVDLKGPTGEAAITVDADLVRSSSNPSVPPRLELSATVVDFGQLSPHGHSPEQKIRLDNAGGGSLNPRAATTADWLKLRQDSDELVVTVDTATVGEYEGAITIGSDGGSATIRVQARIVASEIASEEHTDTNRPPSGYSPQIQPATPATQEGGTSQRHGGTPVRQRLRISAKAWIFGGASAGLALIAVLIAALASSHTPQPARPANSAPPPTFLFIDDFSGTMNGWTIAPGHGSTGKYSNGTYQVHLNPVKLDSGDYLGSGLVTPVSVSVLNPAPQNITIGVAARQLTPNVNTDYGIACRSNRSAYTYYDFEIASDGDATIDKATYNNYTILTQSHTAPVNVDGTNQLQVDCATINGQNAVHLVFWVNGKKILDVIDRKNPLANGAIGVIADSIARRPSAVQFDNFVVTRN